MAEMFVLIRNESGHRKVSVLLYMTVRHFCLPCRTINDFLTAIGAHRSQTVHKWADTFISGYFETFVEEGWRGKHFDGLYDVYPELEAEGRTCAVQCCSSKLLTSLQLIWPSTSMGSFQN